MTEREFIKRCHDVLSRFEDKDIFDECIHQILKENCIDLEKCPQNYIPVYWVMGALFKRETKHCLEGSVDDKTRRKARKEAKNIARFIPSWF